MFNSAQTNEEQPDNSHTNSIDWVFSNDHGSIWIWIHKYTYGWSEFPFLVTGVISKYCVLGLLDMCPDRKKKIT